MEEIMKLLGTKEVADRLGLHQTTIIQWCQKGKIKAFKVGSVYRIPESEVYRLLGEDIHITENQHNSTYEKIAIYARVSQRSDKNLENQVNLLKQYCISKGYTITYVVKDTASSFNFRRSGLKKLLDLVFNKEITRIVIYHKDRLSRIAFDLFEYIFNKFNVEIEIVDNDDKNLQDWQIKDLTDELISFIHYITSRLYGFRSYKRELQKLRECVDELQINNHSNPEEESNKKVSE